MSVIYEVNLQVQKEVEKQFSSWLTGHIQEVLAIDGFESTKWFKTSENPREKSETVKWTMHYYLRDLSALESYLEKHAARLRQPAKDQFGDKFQATRRVLEPVLIR